MDVWYLKKNEGKKFFNGHPWVFANELCHGFQTTKPGTSVELRDQENQFLASGYGNPHSLIAFRELSRTENPITPEHVHRKFFDAIAFRKKLGLSEYSHRLCFGESDGLAGLIVDLYILFETGKRIYVLQSHTAGADQLISCVLQAIDSLEGSHDYGVILKNNAASRFLEGLKKEESKILQNIEDITLEHVKIKTPSHDKGIWVDLMTGQKTGFFLDQSFNIQLVSQILEKSALMQLSKVKILDLFSYAGQWGAALGSIFPSQNVTVCATDASEPALNFAKENLNIYNLANKIIKCDLLKDFASLEQAAFDVVICDPPALIKSRKHIFTGQKGYLKLNTDALKCVKSGGFFITCSCSRLLSESDFFEILNHASIKAKKSIQWIGRGVQSPDHPILARFPEGQYLKCWIGVVSMSNYY